MYTLIIGLIIFFAVILVLAILAQNSKGGGLSSQFGGSGASNMFGVKKTGDFLEKATWGLAILIIVLSLTANLNFMTPQRGGTNDILERAGEQAPANPGFDLPTPSTPEQGEGDVVLPDSAE